MLSTQCQKILVDVEVYVIVGTKHSLTENAPEAHNICFYIPCDFSLVIQRQHIKIKRAVFLLR